jgi:hypothetical protein
MPRPWLHGKAGGSAPVGPVPRQAEDTRADATVANTARTGSEVYDSVNR